jgi:VWFA-related protein
MLMHRALAGTLFVCAALGALGGAPLAQGPERPPAGQPTFRAGIDIRTVEVSVLDKNRRAVRGLTKADFTVLEDGKPQTIVAFRAVEIPGRTVYPAAWMRDVAPDVVSNMVDAERVTVIFLDDVNVGGLDAAEIGERAKRIGHTIVDELGPLDTAAVIYSFREEWGQELTADRARLHTAIDRFAGSAPAGDGNPPSAICFRNDCVVDAFKNAAKVLNGWPGKRKTLVYVSPQARFVVDSPAVEMSASGGLGIPNINTFSNGWDLRDIFVAFHAANVNIYQFDPSPPPLGVNAAFGMMAENTGGQWWRSATPWDGVPTMFEENNAFYVIGYESSHPEANGHVRDVQVKVARKDVKVRASDAYQAANAKQIAKQSKKPQPPPLEAALAAGLPSNAVAMNLSVVPFAMSDTVAAVAIVAGLDRAPDSPEKDMIEVAARAYDQSRKSSGVATAKIALTRRPRVAGPVHYDLATRLNLAPGDYEIRLAATSPAAALTGSAYASITVPDFSRSPLTLSGVVLGRLPFKRAPGNDTLDGLLPFTPTTTRAFTRGDQVGAYVRLYQGGGSAAMPPSLTTRIVDQYDRTVFERTETTALAVSTGSLRTAAHQVDLPLQTLEPGEYLLTIEAAAGDATTSRQVRFQMADRK